MTVAELQEAKRLGIPVILKANPPRTYSDIKFKRVRAVVMRSIKGVPRATAVLEDYTGRSTVYADPRLIVREE